MAGPAVRSGRGASSGVRGLCLLSRGTAFIHPSSSTRRVDFLTPVSSPSSRVPSTLGTLSSPPLEAAPRAPPPGPGRGAHPIRSSRVIGGLRGFPDNPVAGVRATSRDGGMALKVQSWVSPQHRPRPERNRLAVNHAVLSADGQRPILPFSSWRLVFAPHTANGPQGLVWGRQHPHGVALFDVVILS